MAIDTPTYACKCLNVRIYSRSTLKDATQYPDDEYISTCVDDDGIVIQHSQLTLRMRSKAIPDSTDSSKSIRYMSLICLNCQSLVYRVSRSNTLNGEERPRPGPVIPTEEWVEKDVLKTSTGTVEVHKGCLTRDAILQEESNPSYSSIFRIVLPSDDGAAEPMTPVPQLAPEAASPEPTTHLPTLPPLFLPPPFTPSHPAFTYLSSIANSESQAIRDAAEEYLARVTQEKLAEIKAHETRLRQQTESLWSQFRQGLERFGGDKRNHTSHGRKESTKWNGQGNSPSPGTLVTHDFVPAHALHQRPNGGDATPKASALSASLVNSGFHHPRERRTHHPSSSPQPSTISDPSETLIASSPALTNYIELDETNEILEPFRRDMSDSKDLATSFLVLNLEAEMERRRRAARPEITPESSAQGAQQPDTTVAEVTQPNQDTTKAVNGIDRSLAQSPQQNADQSLSETERTSPKAKKGRRKVTFDVQPDVMTIERDATKEQDANRLDTRTNGQAEVSIFELEEDADRSPSEEEATSLPLLELSQVPRQKSHQRSRSSGSSGSGLPQSFSTLRPISLPSPSNSRFATPSESTVTSPKEESTPDSVVASPELPNQRFAPTEDEAMLKLVAAHTPSHRGLWDRDNGKALRMVMGEGDANWASSPRNQTESEAASTSDETGWTSFELPEDIARSLPVFIVSPLASGNPTKSGQPRAPPELPLPLEPKPIVEEIVEEDRDGEGRGRERALRIIQARNKLPEPGMWRSLA
ncbi:hypothetical protein BJ322DRAFT_1112896 [Thelephora terrestris]|uniref:Uncharacterized protein n=1 Tax=Thelephora terrestris TaxID=56493 RepID=A0A9P6H6F7_9AGAM|nr:hypothetical protein BJ322DRAFT_1112896 [Thelephora terrestris]